jgi:hypothetical protein
LTWVSLTVIFLFMPLAYLGSQAQVTTQLIVEKGILLIFCLDWSQTVIPLISASCVADITSVSHHIQSLRTFLGDAGE